MAQKSTRMVSQGKTASPGRPPKKRKETKSHELEEALQDRRSREGGTSMTPQEVIKEKCPKCMTEISPIKVSSSSRNVVFLCPSCGGKRSRMMTKDGFKNEKQKYDYRFAPTSLYGETYAARSKPTNGGD